MKDESVFTHELYHDDLTSCESGAKLGAGFNVISRGMGKYIECVSPPGTAQPSIHLFGADEWRDYRVRAVVTPVSFDTPNLCGEFCGIIARYTDPNNYIALVLDRDDRVKLLRRTPQGFELLAWAALEFCIGQSLSLTLTVHGGEVIGTAGPYSGATTITASLDCGSTGSRGCAGFISACSARFGPHTVECTPEESERIADRLSDGYQWLQKKRSTTPHMKAERTIPLKGLASGANIEFADLNGDGQLELLLGQSSKHVATAISLTKLTCLTALNFDGTILWQAGLAFDMAAPNATPERASNSALPFRFHDLFGDGHPVVVCVFGYDIQVRDAKTGKVLMSAQTPPTYPVSDEFKAVIGASHARYGDETLNMDVKRIDFSDTQGAGAKKEIVVSDDFNLAVLDPLAEPTLHPIFRHRGDLRSAIWIGDIDADGKDEILAGSSVLDDDGRMIRTDRNAAQAHAISVVQTREGGGLRAVICAGDDGLVAYDLTQSAQAGGTCAHRSVSRAREGRMTHVEFGKFRSDVPGSQFAASGSKAMTFFDSNLNKLRTRQFDLNVSNVRAINWTGKAERLLLLSMAKDGGLIDGFGDLIVTIPDAKAFDNWKVIPGYCADGRDAIAAWTPDELTIYVPAE